MPPKGYRSVTLPEALTDELEQFRQAKQLPSLRSAVELLLGPYIADRQRDEIVAAV
jgi:metal-responsive CopG/Arc/MetJ family transcriptional regulator